MIKIAVIEDNAQYRTTVAIILQLNEDLQLIHKLSNCDEMIGRFEVEKPDVVLMDIDMPGMNGIQAVWEIKKEFPEIKVLMLTVFEDDEKIFGAIKAGANGYLLKKDSPQKIIDAIIGLSKGESAMNGLIATKVLEYFQYNKARTRELEESNLTKKENEILQLLMKGASYKEIAAAVFISVETLNSHIKNIYRKLNIHSRAELSARYGNSVK
jgi:DNA-binding NarL/FixJ family response regulator